MSSNFPGALDNGTTLPNPSTTSYEDTLSHAAQHGNANDAVKAVQTKLGTGASAPSSGLILLGTGTGASAWSQLTSAQLFALLADKTGSGSAVFNNTPTLLTPKIDTINEATLNNGVTVAGVNLKNGLIPNSALPSGAVVQVQSTNYSAVATGTTLIPHDDTIPQISEGTEFMTQTITPKSATNRLSIEIDMACSSGSANDNLIVALFQDATVSALAAKSTFQATATGIVNLHIVHDMVAGTTAVTTFRARMGGTVAGTFTFNGQAAGRKFGGITVSNIKVTEYKV